MLIIHKHTRTTRVHSTPRTKTQTGQTRSLRPINHHHHQRVQRAPYHPPPTQRNATPQPTPSESCSYFPHTHTHTHTHTLSLPPTFVVCTVRSIIPNWYGTTKKTLRESKPMLSSSHPRSSIKYYTLVFYGRISSMFEDHSKILERRIWV